MPPRPAALPPDVYRTLLLLGAGGLLGTLLSLQLACAVTELRHSRQLLQQVLTELQTVENRPRNLDRRWPLTCPPGAASGSRSGSRGAGPLPARSPQPSPVIVL